MSARYFKPVSELPCDYEMVTLPNGTQIPRERQTKAQAKIQALKIKGRNEQLRQTLMLLSGEINKGEPLKILEETAPKEHTAICQQIKENKNIFPLNDTPASALSAVTEGMMASSQASTKANESSAIQKQIIVNIEKKSANLEFIHSKQQQHQPSKKSEFKRLNLKKFIFG